jgi:hypothetical protein
MAQVTEARLDDQIAWYDARSGHCQRMFKGLKLAELAAAAAIPCSISTRHPIDRISYRATAEALTHEKLLHAAASEHPDA